jgi:hypothetical protein
MSVLAVIMTTVGSLAGAPTSILIPGPPSGPWQVSADDTRAVSASEIGGLGAASSTGFSDAYQKAWTQPDRALVNRLEHYSSALWAAFHFGESEGAAKKNKHHTSYRTIDGFGNGAYEVTDPIDSEGFFVDTYVFTQGDYLAVIALAARNAGPDQGVLEDQAKRQLDMIPVPATEYNSIGNGVTTTLAVVFGAGAVMAVLVVVITLILVRRNERRRLAEAEGARPGLTLSRDRRYWWDGQTWQDTALKPPPGVPLSADATQWWDGVAWRSAPPPLP